MPDHLVAGAVSWDPVWLDHRPMAITEQSAGVFVLCCQLYWMPRETGP
jgi:hypothetical protein